MRAVTLAVALLTAPAIARPVTVSDFGTGADGRHARLFTLTNAHGMMVKVTDWGGLVTAIEAPDRNGKLADVVLGFSNVGEYQAKNAHYFFGSPIGRFANRIAGAHFALDGRTYRMTPNNGPNLLHSGEPGYNARWWEAAAFDHGSETGVVMTLVSPDGDQGFPGTLTLTMTYTLSDRGDFRIDYRAITSRPTVVNLTNHSYFNLAGEGSGDISGQTIQLLADRIAELGRAALPTGRIVPVSGAYDLRRSTTLGAGMKATPHDGYDDPWVLADGERRVPVLAARATDPASGRTLAVLTTAPAIQLYTSNSVWGADAGPSGRTYYRHGAFALETEHLPDSPNEPAFPSTTLRPGEALRSTTIYRFGVER